MKQSEAVTPVIIALDVPTEEEAWSLLNRLQTDSGDRFISTPTQLPTGKPFVKVGMQLFYAAGPSFLHRLKEHGYTVFADLKMHDIPNTVKEASASLTRLGVDLFNVHALGGRHMMEAALEGVDKALQPGQHRPAVIGVTQLTSTGRTMMNEEMHISGTVHDAVLHLAKLSRQAGLHGVVCSPLEVSLVKEACAASFMTVTPGIRLATDTKDDQVRITTPFDAGRLGTDFIVVGRSVRRADDPWSVYERICREFQAGKRS